MHVGVVAGNEGRDCIEAVRILPRIAEDLGFSSLWFTDHVIGLRVFDPVYGPWWAEVLTSMAHAAATTSTIRLGAGVLVLPVRDAVYTAKALTTIDQLSGGRLDLGVGSGWAYREFEALGRAHLYEQRADVTDEALEVMLRCWQGGEFGYQGRFTSFKQIEFAPVPAQQPHPPLWIGGRQGRALRRAARFADVWHPYQMGPADVAARGAELDAAAGRSVPRIPRVSVAAESLDDAPRLLEEFAAAGCEGVVIDVRADGLEAQAEGIRGLAARVLRG